MLSHKFLAAGAAAMLFGSAAEAAVVRYEVDLTPANRIDGGPAEATTMTFEIPGFGTPLTATAGILPGESHPAEEVRLNLTDDGLGVIHDTPEHVGDICFPFFGCTPIDVPDGGQLDGFRPDEYIDFTIAIPDFEFRLIEATFSRVGLDDQFRLIVFSGATPGLDVIQDTFGQDGLDNFVFCGLAGLGDAGVCTFTFLDTDGGPYSFSALTGDRFRFTIPSGTNDDYRISQVVWEIDVPEPATLGVLGVALAGLGLVRRRKA